VRHHHHVYVIELDDRVWNSRDFRAANLDHDMLKPCVYVGCTGLTPERRFENHRRGLKANRFVQRFGMRLRPDLYAYLNPMPYRHAVRMEQELADDLRAQGYAVWQH
jgi:predicted GIY-YIG superfamily endonuclease